MKYCPKCGTANRDGSRFCNECGEELGTQTQVECPRCGTVNPIQNVLCSECSGRLPPAVASPADAASPPPIKGLSLPTKSPLEEQDEETDEPEPDDQAPAWLRELGASMSEEYDSDDADTLDESGEVPDWLRDLRASLPEEPDDEAEATEEEGTLPEWLKRPGPASDEEENAFTSAEHEPLEPEGFAAEDGSQGKPPRPDSGEDEVPGWLSRLVPGAAAGGTSIDEEETPGWLTRLVPGETEDVPELAPDGGEGEEEKIPDWLAALGTTDEEEEAQAARPEIESEEAESSAGFASLQPVDEEAEAEAARRPAEAEEDAIPDWLADFQSAEEDMADETAQAAGEAEGDEIASWMAERRLEDEDSEAAAPFAPLEIEEGEIPEWMAELQPEDEEAETELMPAGVDIEEGEIPDWLAELRPTDEEIATGSVQAAIEREGEQFPDRVTELEPPSEELPLAETLDMPGEAEVEPSEEAAHRLPDDVEAALAGAAIPAWLAALRTEAPEAAQTIVEETLVDGELPDWLVRSEIEPDKSLAPAEIPGWLLALKPTELREEGEEAEIPAPAPSEGVEETGLLAGIRGALPVEMLIAQPRAIVAAEALDVEMEDSPQARLFADVVGRPPDATPKEIVSPKTDVLPAAARWIIYAILIIVVAIPIIVGEPLLSRTIEPTAATVDLHGAIESLASRDPVLVAFDYDPSSSGEMDVIARALIGHLMDKEARVLVVSLLPAGPAAAQAILDELADDRPAYAGSYGDQYANLGYLPGQAAGVRLLGLSMETAVPRDHYGTPLSHLPVTEGVDTTQDFRLIVELAAAQDTLRWWIEQAGTPYSVPLGAGSSAAVVPVARPYYETGSRQLVGLVGGVPEAVTYEALANEPNGPTSSSAARLDSQLAGQIVFILVILAGNVIYFSRRGTKRGR